MSEARLNFVRQQGFQDANARTCDVEYPALMFQPRVVGLLVLAGVLLQSPALFLILSAVLWWSALVPRANPFDRLHDLLATLRQNPSRLAAAPAPRRFSQGMAATFMLLIGVSLLTGWRGLAGALEGLLLIALGALVIGKFCLGSYLFHLFTGNGAFAKRTLPWSRGV